MKSKIQTIIVIFIACISFMSFYTTSYAETSTIENSEQATELLEMKETTKGKLEGYIEKYGSTTYGTVAYILNTIRIFSIPLCFLGIAIGVINQYVIGIRKLDVRDKGFNLIISFVTILLICQVLPLVFTIVVRGWRG